MNTKKSQPHYSEAKKTALLDIKKELTSENKCFIAFNSLRTKKINIIISSDNSIIPEPLDNSDDIYITVYTDYNV